MNTAPLISGKTNVPPSAIEFEAQRILCPPTMVKGAERRDGAEEAVVRETVGPGRGPAAAARADGG
jgi:hypothetical protein